MATAVAFNNLTYHGNDGDIGSAIVKRVIQGLRLEELGFVVRTDVTVRSEMLFVGLADKLTRAGTGCGVSANNGNLRFDSKWLEPKDLEIEDVYCAKDFDNKIKGLALKLGVNLKDLTDTDLGRLIVELYADVWMRDSKNLAINGDTANASPFYSTMDGAWKYLFAGVAAAAGDGAQVQRFTAVTTALPADYARDIFLPGLYALQPKRMKEIADTDKVYAVTDAIWENYYQSLSSNGQLESSFSTLQNGTQVLKYRGINVVKEYLFEEGATDLTSTRPNRGWLTVKGNLEVGMDTDSQDAVMDFFYDKKSKTNTMRINWKEAVNYAQGDMTVVGY